MSRGINFIKNIGQLITGGIGVISDQLYFKDSQGNVKHAKGYKELVFTLTQTGTNAPEINIINNELGVELTAIYNAVGRYTINYSEPIPLEKSVVLSGNEASGAENNEYVAIERSFDRFVIKTYGDGVFTFSDVVLKDTSFVIKVYD